MAAYERPTSTRSPRTSGRTGSDPPPLRDRDLRRQPVAGAGDGTVIPEHDHAERGGRALLHGRRPRELHDRRRGSRRALGSASGCRTPRPREPRRPVTRERSSSDQAYAAEHRLGLRASRLGLALPRRRLLALARSGAAGPGGERRSRCCVSRRPCQARHSYLSRRGHPRPTAPGGSRVSREVPPVTQADVSAGTGDRTLVELTVLSKEVSSALG